MPDILTFALEYVERGWPVIPTLGKQPITAWTEYQQRLPTTDQVRAWFNCQGGYNVAIVTGSCSGLVVVDCDSEEDTTWWMSRFPPSPLTVATGGGGAHFYYRHPGQSVRNRCRLFGRKIDLRADGGLVVAPPSIHPETGRAYQWKHGFGSLRERIPEFEDRWIAPRRIVKTSSLPAADRHDSAIRDGVAYIQRIKAVAGEQGHNATFRAACKLRDSGLTPSQSLQVLAQWNETNAEPPWSSKELVHKVEDAYRNA